MIQPRRLFDKLDTETIRRLVDRNNSECPLYNFVGNNSAIDCLSDILYNALGLDDRASSGLGISIFGQASTGKSMLVKIFGDILQLPFLDLQSDEIISNDFLLERIIAKLDEEGLYLTNLSGKEGGEYYEIPPMVIFLDEVHALPPLLRNSLLSALEQKSSLFFTPKAEVKCKNVYWFIATTERGRLPLPFESRFVPVVLDSYTITEVTKIIQLNTKWDIEICKKIAVLTKIPRQAIAFATQVDMCAKRSNISLLDAVELTAERKGIDENGIDKRQINVMMALAMSESGQSIKSLCNTVGVNVAEMERYILPILLLNTRDNKPYVTVSNKHRITEHGINYLIKKGLIND